MSLSKEPAYSELKNHFVCGYKNIMGEAYAGNSGTHTMRGNAVDTTNGAGSHNIQMFMMTPDGTVLHCLPGYWNPNDLSSEIQLALKLNDLYNNNSISPSTKMVSYYRMQMDHVRQHPSDEAARSELQGFDMKAEAHKPKSDFVKDRSYIQGDHWGPESHLAFKTTDVVMHERMANRPFLPYQRFDVAHFCDYGTHTYDKHEDNLDENGRMVGEAAFVPIKNGKSMAAVRAAAHPGASAAAASPRVYVKTYGVVRKSALPGTQTGNM